MIKHNELIIDGVRTSSFNFEVIVETSPTISYTESKSSWIEHDGISGFVVMTNRHRKPIEKSYTIHLVRPTEEEVFMFTELLSRENFWLENEQDKQFKLWCYYVRSFDSKRDFDGSYSLEVTFVCHATKFMKQPDIKTFTTSGTLDLKGTALAFPKITITGNSNAETSLTIGDKVIRFEQINGTIIMTNDTRTPSVKTSSGKNVNWLGDFITLDPTKQKRLGIVLGTGIQSVEFETLWGWK